MSKKLPTSPKLVLKPKITQAKAKSTKELKGNATVEPETKVHFYEHSNTSQSISFVLLDEKFAPNSDYGHALLESLQELTHQIKVFNGFDACMKTMRDIHNEKVLFIVSGRFAQKAVDAIHSLQAIVAIFIFTSDKPAHESWVEPWTKVVDIFTNETELIDGVSLFLTDNDNDLPSVSVISAKDVNTEIDNRMDASYMYTALIKDILLERQYEGRYFEDFIQYCRERFGNESATLAELDQFRADYTKRDSIWWYTSEIFLYKMLNEVLYNQDFNGIVRLGFFIKRLHERITELHNDQKKCEEFPVYRGESMSKKRFEKIKGSKGGLLSFNNFLSTSTERTRAETFIHRNLGKRKNFGVVFCITIDPSKSLFPFAFIEEYTAVKGENEVLFSILTVFRVESIEQSDSDERIWNVKLTLTSDSDAVLMSLQEQIRREIEGPTPSHRLAALLIRLNQLDKAKEVCEEAKKRDSGPLGKAHTCYQLGQIQFNKGESFEAIHSYTEAVRFYAAQSGADHQNIGTIYNNMGLAYVDLAKYPEALKFFEDALLSYKKNLPADHIVVGTCYSNIATVYDKMKDYSKALQYHDEASKIYDRNPSSLDPRRAMRYNNVGLIYLNLKRYSDALKSFESAVYIGQRALPAGDLNLKKYKQHLEHVQRVMNK